MRLPIDVQTTMLKSFWIVFCLVLSILVAIVLYFFLESYVAFLILLFIPVMIYPGYKYHDKITGLYRLTNRIILRLNRVAQKISLFIIHYVFLFSYRFTDRDNYLELKDSPIDSMWNQKIIKNLTGEDKQNDVSSDRQQHEYWLWAYLRWVMKSRYYWLLPLIPFMLIISISTDSKISKSVDHDTYTLY